MAKRKKENLRRLKQKRNKQKLVRRNWTVTSMTDWHLGRICAENGWSEKDKGRAVDLVTKEYCERRRNRDGMWIDT